MAAPFNASLAVLKTGMQSGIRAAAPWSGVRSDWRCHSQQRHTPRHVAQNLLPPDPRGSQIDLPHRHSNQHRSLHKTGTWCRLETCPESDWRREADGSVIETFSYVARFHSDAEQTSGFVSRTGSQYEERLSEIERTACANKYKCFYVLCSRSWPRDYAGIPTRGHKFTASSSFLDCLRHVPLGWRNGRATDCRVANRSGSTIVQPRSVQREPKR